MIQRMFAGALACVCLLLVSSFCPAQATRPAAQAPYELYVIFDKKPQMQGMDFDRGHVAPTEVKLGGKTYQAWKAKAGSNPKARYIRSFAFTITDPRFKNGGQPAVDIEVEFSIPTRQSVRIICDTERGNQKVSDFWGSAASAWHKSVIHLDDAHFDGRTDGFDLRVDGYNDDLYIRSIRIKGYDRDVNPDYSRLLKIDSTTSDRDVFAFPRDGQHTLQYHLHNLAHKAVDADCSLDLTDRDGNRYTQTAGTAQLAGDGATIIPFTFDTTKLKYGVYSVNLALKQKSTGAPIFQHESYIGVISDTQLPKAKDGEFYYGLDSGVDNLWNNLRLTAWTRIMGVDIIRSGVPWNPGDINQLETKLAEDYKGFADLGLRVMPVLDPPKDVNPQKHETELARKAEFCEALANHFPQIQYYELGNEPDLTFFYPGPIENYVKDFTAMSRAIKRGNPKAIVGTAGLCFAGADATRRARRFVELVDPADVDAWAYHGHGPGSRAERSAYTRIVATAKEFGKADKIYMETESGVAARTKYQEDGQARTCIEKMVYAQSVHLPLHMWFRLLMFSEDYGNLRTQQEPRPAVLAYRAMVEALRGYHYQATVDLQKPETEAYTFNQADGNGRAMVLWSNDPASYGVYLALGSSADAVQHARVLDMYGNPIPTEMLGGGTIRVTVSENPIFVKWETSEPAFVAQRTTSVIDTAPVAQLTLNSDNPLSVTVHNPFDHPLNATLGAAAVTSAPIAVTPASQAVSIAPHQAKQVDFSLKVGDSNQALTWPTTWAVFIGADGDKVDLTHIAEVPHSLAGVGGDVPPQYLSLKDSTIDFVNAGGKIKAHSPAFIFAEVDSPADQTLTMGASADFWMAWYVNGKPVYDTLATGNGGGSSFMDHTFTMPLKKGRNLLAALVQSGSMGWKIMIGSPAQVSKARHGGNERLTFTLAADGKNIATETLGVQYILPIQPLANLSWTDDLQKWEPLEPTATLDGSDVLNFFFKEPDSSKWWKGEKDLSAQTWLRADANRLYLIVKVLDDVHVTSATHPQDMAQADSLQLGVSSTGKGDFNEYTIGQIDGKTTIFKQTAGAGGAPAGVQDPAGNEIQAQVTRDETAKVTTYRISLDRKLLGTSAFYINLAVNDNDAGYRKQVIQWKPGLVESKDPSKWYRGVFGQ
jgi:hypothetical protein